MVVNYILKDIKFPKQTASIKKSFLNRSKSYNYDWQSLENNLEVEGYNPEKYCYITISKDGYLQDGHHRVSVLQNMFINDENKTILVYKSKFKYNLGMFLTIITLLIFSPVLIYRFLFKKIKSIFK